jgi:hypothetical protein
MLYQTKIIKIDTLWKDKDDVLKKHIENLVQRFKYIDSYVNTFKRYICSASVKLSIKMLEKLKEGDNLSEKFSSEIVNNFKNVFEIEKIKIFINLEDEKILKLYFPDLLSKFEEIEILSDQFLGRGECRFDYSFLTMRLEIIKNTRKIKNLISSYFRNNYTTLKENDILEKSNEKDELNDSEDDKIIFFEELEKNDIGKIVELLLNEETEIVSVILGNLKPEITSEVLWRFPAEIRYDVINKLSRIKKIPKNIVKNIGETAVSLLKNNSIERSEFMKKSYLRKKENKYEHLHLLVKSGYK